MMKEAQDMSYTPAESNVEYVITADFDNKYGHTLKYQYPHHIPGFESPIDAADQSKSALLLASLMIPSNVEQDLSTGADFTVFMLYLNPDTKCYELFPSDRCESESTLVFLNVVIAEENTQDARGAKIKALAFGTKLKCFRSFKSIIQRTLENLMRYETFETTIPFLIDFYNSINSIDLSFVKRIHDNKILQNIFLGINSADSLRDLLDNGSESKNEVLKFLQVPDCDKYGNKIGIIKGHLCITYDVYKPREPFKNFKRTPLIIDLIRDAPLDIEIKYHDLVAKLMVKLIPLLRKRNADNTSFKIILNSNSIPKNEICQFVIALGSLMSCFSSENTARYYRNGPIVILPYTEVGMIDSIRQHLSLLNSSNTFAIIGTANPMFKLQYDLWDFFYDMDKDTLFESNKERFNSHNKKWDSMPFKKMLNRRSTHNFPAMDSAPEECLMTSFFEILSHEKPDNATTIKALRKLNLFQLLNRNLFKDYTFTTNKNLLDEYLVSYKDFVIFEDLYNNETMRVVRLLDTFSEVIDMVFESGNTQQNHYPPLSIKLVTKLNDALYDIHSFLSTGNNSLEMFMSVCLSFPFVTADTDPYSSTNAASNTTKDLISNFRVNNSWLHLVDNRFANTAAETFGRDRSLNLFILPLLLNSDIREKPPVFAVPEETPASSVNERPKSAAFKWMLNLGNHKALDHSMEASSIRSGSETYSISSVSTSKLISSTLSNDSSLSTKMDLEGLQQLIITSKNTALKILKLIESHVIGQLMLEQNLHPYFQVVYNCMKLQQRNDFMNYEIRLSKTERSFKSMLDNDHKDTETEKTKNLTERTSNV